MKKKVQVEVDVTDRGPGFYKLRTTGETLLYALHVYNKNWELHIKSDVVKDGWKHFDTEDDAKKYFNVTDKIDFTFEEFKKEYNIGSL